MSPNNIPPGAGQATCKTCKSNCCPMQREYEICDCAITYFQFCEEDSGGDNYGTAITYINWGDKFDVRIGVDITRLACRVSSTAYFEDAGGTMDLPLDDVSYLWDPDEQKTLPCEVACHEYRLNYNDIYGTNTLKVTSARRCDGESISAGEQISPGQMIKFILEGIWLNNLAHSSY